MNLKEKLISVKEDVVDWIKTYKKIIIPVASGMILFFIIMFNMSFFQVTYFKIKRMPDKVVNILTKAKQTNYDDFYFRTGLDYLIEDLSEVSKAFLEKHFEQLDSMSQEKIIKNYNSKEILFVNQQEIFEVIIKGQTTEHLKGYMKRLDDEIFERALSQCFDSNIKLTQDSVDGLYTLLCLRGDTIPLEKFSLSIFQLLNFPYNGDIETNALKVLDFIEPESIKRALITELKTKEIEVKTLSTWIDILNKKRVITAQEYISFTNYYGMIKKSQEAIKQIQIQEVDLLNMKQTVDIETDVLDNQIKRLAKEKDSLNEQSKELEKQVSVLKNYKQLELYILDRYENGEYEAAIPEKSWLFGTYKPSSQRVRLKTTRSAIEEMGVQSFAVYENEKVGNNVLYFTEVSDEQLIAIQSMEEKAREVNTSMVSKQNEMNKLSQEIGQIRKTNNYDTTLSLIEELEIKKDTIIVEIEKNRLAIQSLFGIGNVMV
ncbi:MAG: hypothetical protein RR448_05920 [Niameybacter sp.]|uniref:hypothetical protein n=1 Tax=Niameybacter sp. TaxID=2033640 RepID=UPI002FC5AFBD